MEIQIKKVDEKNNITQITTVDERWYIKEKVGKNIGDEVIKTFVPSVTWITSYYPKGIGYMKYLAQNGWDESQELMKEAGNRGSKVHKAIEDLINGKEVKMSDKYYSDKTKIDEEITVEEWECIMSFHEWFKIVNPISQACEIVVFNEKEGYAGTVDFICIVKQDIKLNRTTTMKRGIYIIDWKTSKDIYPSHELQVSAYKYAIAQENKKNIWNSLTEEEKKDEEFKEFKLGILQVGYRKAKAGFKFNLIQDQFVLFLATRKIWEKECGNISPRQIDYPLSIKLYENKTK